MGNRKIYYLRGTCEHTTVRLNGYLDFLNSLRGMRWVDLLNAREHDIYAPPFIELARRFEEEEASRHQACQFMS